MDGVARSVQPAAHVVVVHVGLEDMGYPNIFGANEVEHPVNVSLRVDHDRGVAVVNEVAVVAQAGRVDDNHLCQRVRRHLRGHPRPAGAQSAGHHGRPAVAPGCACSTV